MQTSYKIDPSDFKFELSNFKFPKLDTSKLDLTFFKIKEEENPFVKAMKKVWEFVKCVFEKIAQFFVDAWHSLFDKKIDQAKLKDISEEIPLTQNEKVKVLVKKIILGQALTFKDCEAKQAWYLPLTMLDPVREKLITKGYEKRITYQIINKSELPAEETSDWHILALDWKKFSPDEIIRLAVQQLKKGEKINFHSGASGDSIYPYRFELVQEVKAQLTAEGYEVDETQTYFVSGTVTTTMTGKPDGVSLTATKKQDVVAEEPITIPFIDTLPHETIN